MNEKKCYRCETLNPPDATYCKSCGINLGKPFRASRDQVSNILLTIGISIVLLNSIYWLIVPLVVEDWWMIMRIPSAAINLIAAFALIPIALTARNFSTRLILLIMAVIYSLIFIFEVIYRFLG